MKKHMKKLVLGVGLVIMAMSMTACQDKATEDADTNVKVETNVEVDTGNVETDVEVDTGDVETDVEVDTGNKVTVEKYIGQTGKDINNAGYKYVSYSYRHGEYVVKYVIYDIETDIKKELMKLQGSNIAKILIENDSVGLGYEPNGDKYKFKLTTGSVYMNFELDGSEYVFEQYRYEDVKKIRDMGELHSIPISNLQIDYMYCYAVFDESGDAIIGTDNFTDDAAQEMLSGCTVEDFYYEYSLKGIQ